MITSAISTVLGLAALQLAPQANEQAVSRLVYSCNGCISDGQLHDVDLAGALAAKQLGPGTYFLAVDGPNNTSVFTRQRRSTRQPHREVAGGRYLVMKPVDHPFISLASTMLRFYRAQPMGWTKEFTAPPPPHQDR